MSFTILEAKINLHGIAHIRNFIRIIHNNRIRIDNPKRNVIR